MPASPTRLTLAELQRNTSAVIRRVEDGERILVTVAGRDVVELRPFARRSEWKSSAEVARTLGGLRIGDTSLWADVQRLREEDAAPDEVVAL